MHAFRQPPPQPGNPACDDCYGLGWSITEGTITRCTPCSTYEHDQAAAHAASEALASMFQRLRPGEQLVRGHGYQPFVLEPLSGPRATCPGCADALVSIEAGYDRYGTVTLDDHALVIKDEGFSDDGHGPHYLWCVECQRAYAPPDDYEIR